jgi:hypothetical protein
MPPPSGRESAARHGCTLRPASAWRAGDDPVVGKRDAGAARVGVDLAAMVPFGHYAATERVRIGRAFRDKNLGTPTALRT